MTIQTIDPQQAALMHSVFSRFRGQLRDPQLSGNIDIEVWDLLVELGLTRLTGTGDDGGEATWIEAAALLQSASSNGVPVPLAENDLLAGWLLDQVGLEAGTIRRTACIVDDSGAAPGVAWASQVDRVVVLQRVEGSWFVHDIPTDELAITRGLNLANEPRDNVQILVAPTFSARASESLKDEFVLRGALARTLQICGAFSTILDICTTYTAQRLQFGRPISRFQAVQRLVSEIAIEFSLSKSASERALHSAQLLGWAHPVVRFNVAVAKSCTGHAASVVARNAHQALGAIGSTYEHELHRYTLPAVAWSSDFGSLASWDALVAQLGGDAGPDGIWSLITGTPMPEAHVPA